MILIPGITEYCGIPRSGKSTLMVRDIICKLLPLYGPENCFGNFPIFIPGITAMENAELIEKVFQIFRDKERHKVIYFDEVGQELRARESFNKKQIEFVTSCWQMPKRDICLLYCSNPGNSADIILRLATSLTLVPSYRHGPTRDEDSIEVGVIYNWELYIAWWTVWHLTPFQGFFDSFAPIDSRRSEGN